MSFLSDELIVFFISCSIICVVFKPELSLSGIYLGVAWDVGRLIWWKHRFNPARWAPWWAFFLINFSCFYFRFIIGVMFFNQSFCFSGQSRQQQSFVCLMSGDWSPLHCESSVVAPKYFDSVSIRRRKLSALSHPPRRMNSMHCGINSKNAVFVVITYLSYWIQLVVDQNGLQFVSPCNACMPNVCN